MKQNEFLIDSNFRLRGINRVWSGIYASIWPLSLVGSRSFSDPYFSLKWGVQRSAVSHQWHRPNGRVSRSILCKDSLAIVWEQTPNLAVLTKINRGTLQMMTLLKREERQMAEQVKVWHLTFCQSSIKLMVRNLTDSGSALGYAISHSGDLLGTSRVVQLEMASFALCWGLIRLTVQKDLANW